MSDLVFCKDCFYYIGDEKSPVIEDHICKLEAMKIGSSCFNQITGLPITANLPKNGDAFCLIKNQDCDCPDYFNKLSKEYAEMAKVVSPKLSIR